MYPISAGARRVLIGTVGGDTAKLASKIGQKRVDTVRQQHGNHPSVAAGRHLAKRGGERMHPRHKLAIGIRPATDHLDRDAVGKGAGHHFELFRNSELHVPSTAGSTPLKRPRPYHAVSTKSFSRIAASDILKSPGLPRLPPGLLPLGLVSCDIQNQPIGNDSRLIRIS
jgi:hypothetical protein